MEKDTGLVPGSTWHHLSQHEETQTATTNLADTGIWERGSEFKMFKKGEKEKKRHCCDNLEKWCYKTQWGRVQVSTIRQE